MAGKNRISQISNLTQLRKLDVLDLHSNEITEIKGLESQTELRVLNLAGNKHQIIILYASFQVTEELESKCVI